MKNLKAKSFIIFVVVLFVLIVLLNCFQTIPTGFVGIKTRFGKALERNYTRRITFYSSIYRKN